MPKRYAYPVPTEILNLLRELDFEIEENMPNFYRCNQAKLMFWLHCGFIVGLDGVKVFYLIASPIRRDGYVDPFYAPIDDAVENLKNYLRDKSCPVDQTLRWKRLNALLN